WPAVRALTTLSQDSDADVVATTFFTLMRRYNTRSFNGSNDPRWTLSRSIEQSIWEVPVEAVADAFVAELKSPNGRSRDFITWMVAPPVPTSSSFHTVSAEYYAALRKREPQIVQQLIANAKNQPVPELKLYNIDRLVDLRRFAGLKPEDHEDFLPLLSSVENVKADKFLLGTLVQIAPDTDGLAEALLEQWQNDATIDVPLFAMGKHAKSLVPTAIQWLQSGDSDKGEKAIALLENLGAEAKPALDAVKEFYETYNNIGGAVKAIESDMPSRSLDEHKRNLQEFLQLPRQVPGQNAGMMGGGMGTGMF
ncbi:MAG: hypothetical protein KDB27_27165, partial [Planctomycetales bacterium]|nr:hypothetical protein [Planctomycetales bacterium]